MEKTYIMLKDNPVLEIENYNCKILDYDRLPIALRYQKANYDDVMHGWTEARTMSIGKTNAKKILAGFHISQSNPYMIAKMFHFASLSDSYWMKEEKEQIAWDDVSLFKNTLEKAVSATALLGVSHNFQQIRQKIHTPELTAQGMAAKAWIREEDGLYLYKIGKKEVAASAILDRLEIPHVPYTKVSADKLLEIADKEHINKIHENDEMAVKCKIISSEDISLAPGEDFQMYCAYHDFNEYERIRKIDPVQYYGMQIADYIIGNEDRHGANFGFFMDNAAGKLLNLYPLMDHDHAFSLDKEIVSQTSEAAETLRAAALNAIRYVDISIEPLFEMEKPEEITSKEWNGVIERAADINIEIKKRRDRT